MDFQNNTYLNTNTMKDFEQYWNQALSERLISTEASKMYVNAMFQLSVVDVFLNNKLPRKLRLLFKPLDQFIRLFCIYFIPKQITDAFDLHLSKRQRTMMTHMLKCIRWIHHMLPKRFTIEGKVRRLL